MLTGELRNQIDRIWDAFWSGGISNPLEVIEQITYLLFLRRLDDLHTSPLMDAALLYESPFTDITPQGPDGLFTSSQVDELVLILDEVHARAVA